MANGLARSYFKHHRLKFLIGFIVLVGAGALLSAQKQKKIYLSLKRANYNKVKASISAIDHHYDAKKRLLTIAANDYEKLAAEITSISENRSKELVSFDVLSKGSFLDSSTLEKVKIQKALQVELVSMLKAMSFIKDAKVTLAAPSKNMFLKQNSKASVVVEVEKNNTLDVSKIKSIQRLVASSVNSLESEDVNVVDVQGNSHFQGQEGSFVALGGKQYKKKKVQVQLNEFLKQFFDLKDVSTSIRESQENLDILVLLNQTTLDPKDLLLLKQSLWHKLSLVQGLDRLVVKQGSIQNKPQRAMVKHLSAEINLLLLFLGFVLLAFIGLVKRKKSKFEYEVLEPITVEELEKKFTKKLK